MESRCDASTQEWLRSGNGCFCPRGCCGCGAGRTCGADAWRRPPAKRPQPRAAAAEALPAGQLGQQLARSLVPCSGSSLDQECPLAASPETPVACKVRRKCHPLRRRPVPPVRPSRLRPLSPARCARGAGTGLRAPGSGLQEAGADGWSRLVSISRLLGWSRRSARRKVCERVEMGFVSA